MTELTKIEEKDYPLLYDFMYQSWMDTYKHIIKISHIEFLLHKFFDADNAAKYAAEGYMHYYITDNGEKVGLIVYHDRGEEIYLDKFYVLEPYKGKGYASFAMNYLKGFGKDITLSVNRDNVNSISIYKHFGFFVDKIVDTQIGDDMINGDYIMRCKAQK